MQGVSNCMWACANVGHHDPVLMARLSAHCLAHLPSYDVQALANCMWACATLGRRDLVLVDALAKVGLAAQWVPGAILYLGGSGRCASDARFGEGQQGLHTHPASVRNPPNILFSAPLLHAHAGGGCTR